MDSIIGSDRYHIGYDVIIDDASHLPEHQVASYQIFGPYLKKGGVYIIEDIHQDHATWIKTQLQQLVLQYNMRMEWVDLRHIKNRFDDIMAVIYNE